MERLLADAEAISGIHYDISNYADVVEAIHVIQTEMGITGTTALEAATTISGSWGMLQGAWSNLLTSIAGGGDELDVAIQNVFDSLGTYLGNLVPRIVEVARNIFASIPIVAEKALEALPTVITEIVRSAFGDAAADSVGEFLTTLQEKLSAVQEFFAPLADAASEALGSIADLGGDVITALAPLGDFVTGNGPAFAGMMERIQQHLADLGPVVDTLSATWDVLKETFTNFVSVVAPIIAEFLGQLISGIVGLLPIIASVVEAVATVINDVLVILTAFISDAQNGFEGLRSTLAGIWDSIKGKVTEVWEGIKTTITNVWNAIKTGVSTAVNNVKTTVFNVFNSIKSTVSTVWNGIKSAITTPINAARDAVANAIGRIKSLFNFRISWPHIPLPHFSVSGSANPLDWLTGGLPKFNISWYAKGGIAERPTLYAAGIGEAGPEAIMPLRGSKMRPFALAVADEMGGAGTVNNYYIDGSAVAADAQLAAALEVVAQRVSGRQRMGTVR